MGSVVKGVTGLLGGGSSSGASSAINSSANQVATTAQQGGQNVANAINNASNTAYNSILGGSQTAGNSQYMGGNTAAQYALQGGTTAAENALYGGNATAAAQQQALAYLQQQDALPSSLRESALNSLGSLYGGSGSITDRAMASPVYQAAVQQGENSVLRNASATGGLRSGNAQDALATVNQNALVSAYNDQVNGLNGLASLQSNANNIANLQSSIGTTLGNAQTTYGNLLGQAQSNYGSLLGNAQSNYGTTLGSGQVSAAQTLTQGQIAAAQALANANNTAAAALGQGAVASAQNQAQSQQNSVNNLTGLAGLGLTAASFFSDRRLKSNIEFIGEENGIRKYQWTWNKAAEALGLSGKGHGVMADEVEEAHPDAVTVRNGYLSVNYEALGVSHG